MRFGRAFSFVAALMVSVPAWAQEAMTQAAPVTEAVAETHEGSSMPQLDPTYYASQLFWLVICGGLMYVFMAKIALPRVARVLAIRDDQVRNDFEKAARLKQEAEDIKVVYTRALRDADERAKSLVDRTINDMRDKQNQALAEGVANMNDRLAKTEKNITAQKDAVLNEVDAIAKKLSATIVSELTKKAA